MAARDLSLSVFTGLVNAKSFHSLAAGTLLGSCIWGSFFAGVIAYKNLPRQQFGNLQAKTFPVYWQFNTLTSGLMLLNYVYMHPSLVPSSSSSKATSIELFNASLIAVGMLANSLVQLSIITPWTSSIMFRRHRLERELGKSYTDADAPPELKELSSQFGKAHGISSLFNLAYLGAIAVHCAWLATYGF